MTVEVWNNDTEITKFGDIEEVTAQSNIVVLKGKEGVLKVILALSTWWTHLIMVD